jgi:hypothetical protein
MFKKKSIKIGNYLLIAGLIIIACLMYINNKSLVTQLSACNLSKSVCSSEILGHRVTVEVQNQPIEAEKEAIFMLEVTHLTQARLINTKSIMAKIIGKDMYMGRIPVVFNNIAENQYQASSFIGACTEPSMEWLLLVEFEFTDGNRYEMPFQFTVKS